MLLWCSVRRSHSCLPCQRQSCMQLRSNAIKVASTQNKADVLPNSILEWKWGWRKLHYVRKSVEGVFTDAKFSLRYSLVSLRSSALPERHSISFEKDGEDCLLLTYLRGLSEISKATQLRQHYLIYFMRGQSKYLRSALVFLFSFPQDSMDFSQWINKHGVKPHLLLFAFLCNYMNFRHII